MSGCRNLPKPFVTATNHDHQAQPNLRCSRAAGIGAIVRYRCTRTLFRSISVIRRAAELFRWAALFRSYTQHRWYHPRHQTVKLSIANTAWSFALADGTGHKPTALAPALSRANAAVASNILTYRRGALILSCAQSHSAGRDQATTRRHR